MLKHDNEEIPNFEIVKVRVSTDSARSWTDRAEAYEVQCVQQNASTLAKKFREDQFEQDPVVIPYYYRKKPPKDVSRSPKLAAQSHYDSAYEKAR